MNARGDTIGRLAVTWRPDAEPGADGRDRLDGLVRELVDAGLVDGLGPAADRDVHVCVRRVGLPVHRMRWAATDAHLVAGWSTVVRRAVEEAVTAGGPDVVRYASRTHARLDLVTALLRDDRHRAWAWRMLGLWPAGGDPADAEVLHPVLAEVERDEPSAVVGVLVALAGAGLLGRFVDAAGAERVVALVGAAWRAAGGSTGDGLAARGLPGSGGSADVRPGVERAAVDELCAAVAARSAIAAATLPAGVPGPVAGGSVDLVAGDLVPDDPMPDDPVTGPGRADRRSDGSRRETSAGSWPGSLAGVWAAAAVLEVEPALAGRSVARLAAAQLARGWPPAGSPPGSPPPSPAPPRPAVPATGTHPSPGPRDERSEPVSPRPATTAWGGLLFLLPLVADIGLPERVAAAPERFGPGLRPVLHALARHLLACAAPDVGPPDPADPAVLAFAGLAPAADPPTGAPAPAILQPELDALVAALRERIGPAAVPDGVLLRAVCRRRAAVVADPGWIDVLLELDEVSVDVRRAGLDLDPGHLSWLGCVVRFRYG